MKTREELLNVIAALVIANDKDHKNNSEPEWREAKEAIDDEKFIHYFYTGVIWIRDRVKNRGFKQVDSFSQLSEEGSLNHI